MQSTSTIPSNGMSTSNSIADASDRAHDAVNRVADKAAPAVDRAAGAIHRTIDKAAEAATPAAEWVTANGRQLADRSNELAETASGYIRARPLAAVAGALVLGYFAGKLMR